jgi:hypothetical protein
MVYPRALRNQDFDLTFQIAQQKCGYIIETSVDAERPEPHHASLGISEVRRWFFGLTWSSDASDWHGAHVSRLRERYDFVLESCPSFVAPIRQSG